MNLLEYKHQRDLAKGPAGEKAIVKSRQIEVTIWPFAFGYVSGAKYAGLKGTRIVYFKVK